MGFLRVWICLTWSSGYGWFSTLFFVLCLFLGFGVMFRLCCLQGICACTDFAMGVTLYQWIGFGVLSWFWLVCLLL